VPGDVLQRDLLRARHRQLLRLFVQEGDHEHEADDGDPDDERRRAGGCLGVRVVFARKRERAGDDVSDGAGG
jgi:hypothetical protein